MEVSSVGDRVWLTVAVGALTALYILHGMANNEREFACDAYRAQRLAQTGTISKQACYTLWGLVGAIQTAAAALAAYSATNVDASGWQWWKGSEKENTKSIVPRVMLGSDYQAGGNMVLSNYTSVYKEILTIQEIYGDMVQNMTRLAKIVPIQEFSKRNNENDTDNASAITWSFDAGDHLKTVIAPPGEFNKTIAQFRDYQLNINTLDVDDVGPNWLSFNSYGVNLDTAYLIQNHFTDILQKYSGPMGEDLTLIKQYPSGQQTLQVPDKYCLTLGLSTTPGKDSIIVG
uniref:ARAD1D51304p n=1 Tax=Blastobotrys adeninivorans TaxID=409370 RepID=A0A060TDX2_BLAAD